jgi:hypothetical protein
MKIKVLVSLAGDRFAVNPGDVVSVDDDEGQRLVAAGFARALSDKAKETAVFGHSDKAIAEAPETTEGLGGETR